MDNRLTIEQIIEYQEYRTIDGILVPPDIINEITHRTIKQDIVALEGITVTKIKGS